MIAALATGDFTDYRLAPIIRYPGLTRGGGVYRC